MSTATEVNPRLFALTEAGVSVWLDQIRRSLLDGGELVRMVSEDCLRGLTANSAIFEQAIRRSNDYDKDLESLAREQLDAPAIYGRLVVRDVQMAADILAEAHRTSNARDGFVSLGVSPRLAHDTEGMLAESRSYWERLGRPNVMIKLPGTAEGMRASEEALHEGVNVHVTLLFSISGYERAAEAYLRALERRLEKRLPLKVSSVAGLFVSPVDTVVDRELAVHGREELRGKAGIANARAAYRRFEEIFDGPRWAALRHAGALVQRPLWASTGTKDPRYPDTMYVDELVGPHVVNAMAPETLIAVADHGELRGPTAQTDPVPDLVALGKAGIVLERVTDELLVDGLRRSEEAMSRLLEAIEARRGEILARSAPR